MNTEVTWPVPVPAKKFAPVISTIVPAGPEYLLSKVIVGGGVVTVYLFATAVALVPPSAVTNMLNTPI